MGRPSLPHALSSAQCDYQQPHRSHRIIPILAAACFLAGGQFAFAQTGRGVPEPVAAEVGATMFIDADARDTLFVESAQRIVGINSPARDDTPIITADGRLMFFNSTRYGERSWARKQAGRYDDDIYVSRAAGGESDSWREPTNLRPINTSDDDGIVAISSSGNQLYYLSLRRGWQKDGGPFYQAQRDGENVAQMIGLGGGITRFFAGVPLKSQIRVFGASISPDAKSFYFATTAYSHTGDHEIWVSHRSSTVHEWETPENLGPTVNACGGSYAPFIAADGRTLYYSSGRDGGLGGDDIYMVVQSDGQWRQAVNVGAPINSPSDDAFLSLPASGDRVYFASTRSGAGDLFVAPMRSELRPGNVALLSATVLDSAGGSPVVAMVAVEEANTGRIVFRGATSAADGHTATVLRPGGEYVVTITAPGFVFRSERIVVPNDSTFAELLRTYRLGRPIPEHAFRLNNIVFDYNSAILRSESYAELNRLVSFLREAADTRISIQGHTDSTGTADFNDRLSLERAASVRTFLIITGQIDPSRIEFKGFGFSRPIVPNDCDAHREINRRVEFVILGKITDTQQ